MSEAIELSEREREFVAELGDLDARIAAKAQVPLTSLGSRQYTNKEVALAQNRLWRKLSGRFA